MNCNGDFCCVFIDKLKVNRGVLRGNSNNVLRTQAAVLSNQPGPSKPPAMQEETRNNRSGNDALQRSLGNTAAGAHNNDANTVPQSKSTDLSSEDPIRQFLVVQRADGNVTSSNPIGITTPSVGGGQISYEDSRKAN